ncbi:hypothetical protein [Ammoniphilus sp. 3BR4]|uniref:hypothetical protein n=1 Tax=Ammoniphilus sp. 3BR4 TaxID=3158265 RepID=UPI0034663ABC
MFIHDVQDRRGLKWNKDMEGDVIAIIDEMKNKIRSKVVHEVEKLLMYIMENDLNNREILSCSDYSKGFESIYTH